MMQTNPLAAAIPAPAPAPAKPPVSKQDAQNRETAKKFEAVFLGQMTQLMLDSVDKGDFSGGAGEDAFRGILAEKLGTEIANRGGIGLVPAVLDQIIKLQQGK